MLPPPPPSSLVRKWSHRRGAGGEGAPRVGCCIAVREEKEGVGGPPYPLSDSMPFSSAAAIAGGNARRCHPSPNKAPDVGDPRRGRLPPRAVRHDKGPRPDHETEGLSVNVTGWYPFEPPRCRFLTPVYHPNINSRGCIYPTPSNCRRRDRSCRPCSF
jgi:hypothetical protein